VHGDAVAAGDEAHDLVAGHGVQQRESLIQTSSTPLTSTPGSPAERLRSLRSPGRVGRVDSARSSVRALLAAERLQQRCTIDCAETWFSPTAAYSAEMSA
jgi:hypothetical protein